MGRRGLLSFGTAGAIVPPVVSMRESFSFTVRGTDLESIPTAQAQTMPPCPRAWPIA